MAKYSKDYPDKLLDHMTKGLSFEAFAGEVGVHRATLHRWRERYPKFRDAYELGKSKSMLFWEKMGIHGAAGKLAGFNNAAWIFNMKNRFNWTDRQQIEQTTNGNVSLSLSGNATEEIERILRKRDSINKELKSDK